MTQELITELVECGLRNMVDTSALFAYKGALE
jgi:hypothetical protein